jgi:hypothetical protein
MESARPSVTRSLAAAIIATGTLVGIPQGTAGVAYACHVDCGHRPSHRHAAVHRSTARPDLGRQLRLYLHCGCAWHTARAMQR